MADPTTPDGAPPEAAPIQQPIVVAPMPVEVAPAIEAKPLTLLPLPVGWDVETLRTKLDRIQEQQKNAQGKLTEWWLENFKENQTDAIQENVAQITDSQDLEALLNLKNQVESVQELAQILGLIADTEAEAAILDAHEAVKEAPELLLHINLELDLTIVNKQAVTWANTEAANLVTSINNEMRNTIRGYVTQATSGKYTAQTLKRELSRIIPLTPRYQAAVVKMRQYQYNSLITAGKSPSEASALADNRADAYAAKLTRQRAQLIARTEIQFAQNNGQFMGWLTAQGSGLVPNQNVYKEWLTAEDERTCPQCRPLDHKMVSLMEPWPNGALTPPMHPACRCAQRLVDGSRQTVNELVMDPFAVSSSNAFGVKSLA